LLHQGASVFVEFNWIFFNGFCAHSLSLVWVIFGG
jgi:hypothetical protein